MQTEDFAKVGNYSLEIAVGFLNYPNADLYRIPLELTVNECEVESLSSDPIGPVEIELVAGEGQSSMGLAVFE